MDGVKGALILGTGVLAFGTGTLGVLAISGVFAAATYSVAAHGGRHRMRQVLLDEEDRLEREKAFLEKFLNSGQHSEDSPWQDPELFEALQQKLIRMTDNYEVERLHVTWDMLKRRVQNIDRRLAELEEIAKTRLPQNQLAAKVGGWATFLFPPVGVGIIGYNVWKNMTLRKQAYEEALQRRRQAEPATARTWSTADATDAVEEVEIPFNTEDARI